MTIREALARAGGLLRAAPSLRTDASRDAATLLLHALGTTRAALMTDPGRVLTADRRSAYEALITRRLAHEPVQYILGEQEFYGLALHVNPSVLIPRPETECLVEAVLDEIKSGGASSGRILDVGTGSGAIAIALAVHLPEADITAVDTSAAALEVAGTNTVRHNVAGRVYLVQSDLLKALGGCEGCFDAIVSNPPYVLTGDREGLSPQVRDYEPAEALFAGATGLDVYRRLIPQAHAALRPNGLLALEIGYGQRDEIAAMLMGWSALRFVDDLQGIPRVALARKP